MSDETMNGDGMSDKEADAIEAANEARERTEKLVSEYGQEVCDAAAYVFGEYYWQDALEGGAYCGEYRSVTAYAEQYIDDCGLLQGAPDLLACYFDYEAFGRDMELGGDITEHDGHIFNNNF